MRLKNKTEAVFKINFFPQNKDGVSVALDYSHVPWKQEVQISWLTSCRDQYIQLSYSHNSPKNETDCEQHRGLESEDRRPSKTQDT